MAGDVFPVPLDQVQGIVLRGYEYLEEARFVLLEIPNAEAGKAWLRGLVGRVTDARDKPLEWAVNVAFTAPGLQRLGLDRDSLEKLSRQFHEGMDTDHRNRVLGDVEPPPTGPQPAAGAPKAGPELWAWGNRHQADREHALLLVYAKDDPTLQRLWSELKTEWERHGLQMRREFPIWKVPGRKEHFGFRDGIAQPVVKGVIKPEPPGLQQFPPATVQSPDPANAIETGEFLLGYKNEYGRYPEALPVPGPQGTPIDLACYGSFLVVRELRQDVRAFWKYLDEHAARPGQTPDQRRDERHRLGAKMVGRWPSGAPLTLSPYQDNPNLADADDYQFSLEDPTGEYIPLGAHTRRSNPRDVLEPGPAGEERLSREDSLRVTRLHRILRRGRPYGPPVSSTMNTDEVIQSSPPPDEQERGLLFLCFNANIARQFEFIQQTWINNPKFSGLYRDSDPIMGQRLPGELNEPADVFMEQGSPVRRRFTGLPAFVEVRGGGYFFMPGPEALKHLAGLPARLPPPPPPLPPGTVVQGQVAAVAPELFPGESIPPHEAEFTRKLTDDLRAKVNHDYPPGRLVLRDAHPKHHGCVKAQFVIEPNLPEKLRVGVFARTGKPEGRTYDAWVRFSNQNNEPRPDAEKDIRGMAIKLLGVPGTKLLADESKATTQDFVFISADRFVTKDVEEFAGLIHATVRGKGALVWYFLNPFRPHLRVLYNLMTSLKHHGNPLHVRYFSVTPYLFGDRAVKYSVKPTQSDTGRVPSGAGEHYLRDAMRAWLSKQEAVFDFLVQFHVDDRRTPIEDPGKPWPEAIAPFHKVATLRIPPQDFETPTQLDLAEHLSFTPWHSLPEHRPLGGINRARRVAYRAISQLRHHRNNVPRAEP